MNSAAKVGDLKVDDRLVVTWAEEKIGVSVKEMGIGAPAPAQTEK